MYLSYVCTHILVLSCRRISVIERFHRISRISNTSILLYDVLVHKFFYKCKKTPSTRDQCDLEIEGGAGLSTDISLLSRYLMKMPVARGYPL